MTCKCGLILLFYQSCILWWFAVLICRRSWNKICLLAVHCRTNLAKFECAEIWPKTLQPIDRSHHCTAAAKVQHVVCWVIIGRAAATCMWTTTDAYHACASFVSARSMRRGNTVFEEVRSDNENCHAVRMRERAINYEASTLVWQGDELQ